MFVDNSQGTSPPDQIIPLLCRTHVSL